MKPNWWLVAGAALAGWLASRAVKHPSQVDPWPFFCIAIGWLAAHLKMKLND